MRTRIGMMLPGAISLGAYEGGALAAVLMAVQASEGELVIDAIASASAGSMTGLLAARALVSGANPVELMRRAWVDLPQLATLATDELSAPLSLDKVTAGAKALLGNDPVPDGPPGPTRQAVPVRLSMALTALGGLTYAMAQLADKNGPQSVDTLLATTYVDFFNAEFSTGATTDAFEKALDGAMASGSNPLGFPPRLLDRDDAAAGYKANGILSPPDKHFTFWYSDGGDLDNQPFGRLLDLIEQPEAPTDDRVIVVLNIQPEHAPTWDGPWFDPALVPSWLATLLHVSHLRGTQSLYDDLRRLEKKNRRIAWIQKVASALEPSVDPASRDAAAIELAGERQQIREAIHARAGGAAPAPTPAAGDLERLLLEAAGLDGKYEVVVEVISPAVDVNVRLSADQQLSGEFLFHFGGFFDPKFRQSDFALGYRNATTWLERWLTTERVTHPETVLVAVNEGYASLPWRDEELGNASLGSLSLKERLEGLGLLGHIGHVVEHDLALGAAHLAERDPTVRGVVDDIEHGVATVEHGVATVGHGVATVEHGVATVAEEVRDQLHLPHRHAEPEG